MSIQFDRVSKSFGQRVVLNQVSFEVPVGSILFILGKSGAGKSVALKHLVGMLKPDSGSIRVDETEVTTLDFTGLTQIRKKCGMIFRQPALLDSLSVFENVAFGLRQSLDFSEKEILVQVIETLALVNLGPEILNQFPHEISYGTQKRVSLARTLAPKPRYLLFDEPTTGLDPISTHRINDLILELSRKLKVTSIVVSHDMACALAIADRILVLDQAKVLAHDTVEGIKNSPEG